jgi:hypothetical protein
MVSDDDIHSAAGTHLSVAQQLRDRQPRLTSGAGQYGPAEQPASVAPLGRSAGGEKPAAFLRVGEHDLADVCEAVGEALSPDGLVVGLSDLTKVISGARLAARRVEVPLLTDPVFFRCTLEGARVSQHLRSFDYAPNSGHWTVEQLRSDGWRDLVREVFEAQAGRASGGWMAATIALDADPQTLAVNRRLVQASVQTRAAFGREQLIAPLVINMDVYADHDAQLRLIRSLDGLGPDAYVVSLHKPDGRPQRLVATVRLLLLLKSLGVPVLLARAGSLRAFALALGLDGIETGLGRLARFSLDDFYRSGGVGNPPAKYDMRPLFTLFKPVLAARVHRSGLLEEQSCTCQVCVDGWNANDVKGTVFHDAFSVARDLDAAVGTTVNEAIFDLGREVSRARALVDELYEAGIDIQHEAAHLVDWAEAIELVKQQRLDEPDAAARLRDVA